MTEFPEQTRDVDSAKMRWLEKKPFAAIFLGAAITLSVLCVLIGVWAGVGNARLAAHMGNLSDGVVLWAIFVGLVMMSMLILPLGMAAHCISQYQAPVSEKFMWFGMFLLLAPFGSALYYFAIYRRQLSRRQATN